MVRLSRDRLQVFVHTGWPRNAINVYVAGDVLIDAATRQGERRILRQIAPLRLSAHALTHAWVQSPRAWLSEGVAHFMGTLWIEKARGRDQALGALEAARPALALAEPESPGLSLGQPALQCCCCVRA